MPKGTRVSRCVERVKRSGRNVNPYAVCQASTGQSYATGKPIKEKKMNYLDRLCLIYERNKQNQAKKNKAMGRVPRIPAREYADREVHDHGSNPETVGRKRGVKKVRGAKLQESLLEGLYHSMSDMALVLAEALGLTEATRLAKETARKAKEQGTANPQKVTFKTSTGKKVAASDLGVRQASIVKGGEQGVEALALSKGVDSKTAKKRAKDAAGAVRRVRKPETEPGGEVHPITPATPEQIARGLSGGARGKTTVGKSKVRGGSGRVHFVTPRSRVKGKKIAQEPKK